MYTFILYLCRRAKIDSQFYSHLFIRLGPWSKIYQFMWKVGNFLYRLVLPFIDILGVSQNL